MKVPTHMVKALHRVLDLRDGNITVTKEKDQVIGVFIDGRPLNADLWMARGEDAVKNKIDSEA